ncbi:Diacetyl reductase [(S)-acetoin forming] [compost metagenome]
MDVLVLNAGIAKQYSIEDTTEEVFDDLYNINVKGLFFTLQKLIPHLSEGASIVLISSGVSVNGWVLMQLQKVQSMRSHVPQLLNWQNLGINI